MALEPPHPKATMSSLYVIRAPDLLCTIFLRRTTIARLRILAANKTHIPGSGTEEISRELSCVPLLDPSSHAFRGGRSSVGRAEDEAGAVGNGNLAPGGVSSGNFQNPRARRSFRRCTYCFQKGSTSLRLVFQVAGAGKDAGERHHMPGGIDFGITARPGKRHIELSCKGIARLQCSTRRN